MSWLEAMVVWQTVVSFPRALFTQVSWPNGLMLLPMIRTDDSESPSHRGTGSDISRRGVSQESFLLSKSQMCWPYEQGTLCQPSPHSEALTFRRAGDHLYHFSDIKLHPAVFTHTGEMVDLQAAMIVSFCKSCLLGQSCPPEVTPVRPYP